MVTKKIKNRLLMVSILRTKRGDVAQNKIEFNIKITKPIRFILLAQNNSMLLHFRFFKFSIIHSLILLIMKTTTISVLGNIACHECFGFGTKFNNCSKFWRRRWNRLEIIRSFAYRRLANQSCLHKEYAFALNPKKDGINTTERCATFSGYNSGDEWWGMVVDIVLKTPYFINAWIKVCSRHAYDK